MHHLAGSGTLSPEDSMKYLALLALLMASPGAAADSSDLDYEAMAQVAVGALELSPGERVMLRFDPGYFEELTPIVRRLIRQSGAVDVAAVEYMPFSILGETGNSGAEEAAYRQLLEAVDVYIWLPVREGSDAGWHGYALPRR
jgi:hypothetical protein